MKGARICVVWAVLKISCVGVVWRALCVPDVMAVSGLSAAFSKTLAGYAL